MLEDKIEQSQKMNETLEAMARASFKSRFVDFNPVGAEAEAHAPEDSSKQPHICSSDSAIHVPLQASCRVALS